MICNAKRICFNLIRLSENPNYYFNGEGIDEDISYICYVKRDNKKFYTITSGAIQKYNSYNFKSNILW